MKNYTKIIPFILCIGVVKTSFSAVPPIETSPRESNQASLLWRNATGCLALPFYFSICSVIQSYYNNKTLLIFRVRRICSNCSINNIPAYQIKSFIFSLDQNNRYVQGQPDTSDTSKYAVVYEVDSFQDPKKNTNRLSSPDFCTKTCSCKETTDFFTNFIEKINSFPNTIIDLIRMDAAQHDQFPKCQPKTIKDIEKLFLSQTTNEEDQQLTSLSTDKKAAAIILKNFSDVLYTQFLSDFAAAKQEHCTEEDARFCIVRHVKLEPYNSSLT